jgi:3-isopropylmalate/(R)-2-methylmalate dehydratase small subunit
VEPFTRVSAPAVPIDLPNVDTDRIIPARFLRKPREAGDYARYLFHDLRFDAKGDERPEFILNQPPYRAARILVAAENFGCGSSREGAVWALHAYGVRCVIAPSFGDIFFENCGKNGVLAIRLPASTVALLRRQLHEVPGASVTVDLEAQMLIAPDGMHYEFEIDGFRKEALRRGLDEIALTLQYADAIAAFERRRAVDAPWLGAA